VPPAPTIAKQRLDLASTNPPRRPHPAASCLHLRPIGRRLRLDPAARTAWPPPFRSPRLLRLDPLCVAEIQRESTGLGGEKWTGLSLSDTVP